MKIFFWGALLVGVIAIGFYAASKLNLDLSLSNAARALVNQSAQEVLNAPQNIVNKVKEQVLEEKLNAPQKVIQQGMGSVNMF